MKLSEKFTTEMEQAYRNVIGADQDRYILEMGGYFALDNITPKIAIDFAEWIYKNAEMSIKADSGWVIGRVGYTSGALFTEFLKTYKP